VNIPDQGNLPFDVRRSVRYHNRRLAFFEWLHRVTSALTILLCGGVLFQLAETGTPPWWMTCIGVIAALLAAFDMVVSYSGLAARHAALRNRFADLEISILNAVDGEDARSLTIKRLQIEQDEPPIYRALDLLCYHEQCAADGAPLPENCRYPNFLQRLTCQVLLWSNIARPKNSTCGCSKIQNAPSG